MKLISMVERLTDRVVGHVDAGACVTDKGCCCRGTGHPHYILQCKGACKRITSATCHGTCGGI